MQPEIEDKENTGPALKNTKYKIQDSAWMRHHHSSHRGSGVGRICRARQWLEIINGEFPLMGLPTACRGAVKNYQKLKGKKEILKQLWEFQRNMITGNRSLERQQLNNKAVELKTRFPLGCLSACLPSWLQAGGEEELSARWNLLIIILRSSGQCGSIFFASNCKINPFLQESPVKDFSDIFLINNRIRVQGMSFTSLSGGRCPGVRLGQYIRVFAHKSHLFLRNFQANWC